VNLSEEVFVVVLRDQLDLPVTPQMADRLTEDLGLDSLARLEIWVALELLAERPVEPDTLDACRTVRELYALMHQMLHG
jgi:acyl carrier protein